MIDGGWKCVGFRYGPSINYWYALYSVTAEVCINYTELDSLYNPVGFLLVLSGTDLHETEGECNQSNYLKG